MELTTTTTTTNKRDGLPDLRNLIKDYLNDGEGSPAVREYLSSILEDDTLLQIYLKGCRYRARHAWKSLKRRAEVRFNEYPEVFPGTIPEVIFSLQQRGGFGILKARDKFGRRIVCVNADEWDPNEITAEVLTACGTHFMERALLDKDIMNNGVILVANCAGMGMKHAKQCTFHVMMRLVNVFWLAYPVKCKGVFGVNTPLFIRYLHNVMKPFLAKKLKERLTVTAPDKKFQVLHEKLALSPDLLPKFLGGSHENETVFDLEFLQPTK